MSIYEQNLELLKERYLEIEEYYRENPDSARHVSTDENGYIGVEKNGYIYEFSSRYNNEGVAKSIAGKLYTKNYMSMYIVFGMANMQAVFEVMNTCKENVILFYEPDKDIFREILKTVNLQELIHQSRILLCVSEVNDFLVNQYIHSAVSYESMAVFKYYCMPNYNEVYMEKWKDIISKIRNQCEFNIMERNTEINFGRLFINNMIYNSKKMIENHTLAHLVRQIQNNYDVSDKSAILVSAGPSLDKNVKDLKLAKGKAMILAVDSAVKTLLKNGVIPDAVFMVDPEKPAFLFMNSGFYELPLIMYSEANKEIAAMHTGKKFYLDTTNTMVTFFNERLERNVKVFLESGGSVANNAFSLLVVLGFKNIILVGQDLAYPNMRRHANDAFGGGIADNINRRKELVEVEDIYGNKVFTGPDMKKYIDWFERQLEKYPKLHVIDATEGGAKIHGTEIDTLKDAIEKYCKQPFDAKEAILSLGEEFTREQKDLLYIEYENFGETIDERVKKFEKCIRDYDRLDELYRKRKTATKEFKDLVKKVGECTEYVDKDCVAKMITFYSKGKEFEMLGRIHAQELDEKEEIKSIINHGKEVLKAYIEGAKELKKDYENRYNPEQEKSRYRYEQVLDAVERMTKYVAENNMDLLNKANNDFFEYSAHFIWAEDVFYDQKRIDKRKLFDILHIIVMEYEKNQFVNMEHIVRERFLPVMEEIYSMIMR